ncbi:MAG: AsmA family protein [Candidatus Pelagadaptatus aseana]|uniref:AsmA family protein n=1 Tax=Candidatus Pelagadaptatus aseana TaxID=3120508 RepID=UPI0039B201F9
MSKLMKILMALVAAIVAVVMAAVVYLTQVLDPNSFRDDIERLAAEQGVPLSLNGPIAWQWYPRLGLHVQAVTLGGGGQTLVEADSLAAQVAVPPLLKGQVVVAGIELTGVDLQLLVDRQGRGNWQALTDQAGNKVATPAEAGALAEGSGAAEQAASAAKETSPLNLAVEQLQLTDISVIYRDQRQQTEARVEVPSCRMTSFNLQGQLFDLACDTQVHWQDFPEIQVATRGQLGFDQARQRLRIADLLQTLQLNGERAAINLDGELAMDTQQFAGQLRLQRFNPRVWLEALQVALPEMARPQALTALSLSAGIETEAAQWHLSDLQLQLDDSLLQGSASQSAEGTVALLLQGNQLNLDHYLPPAVESEQTPSATGGATEHVAKAESSAAQGKASRRLSDEPLALDGIKPLSINLALGLQQFQVAGVQMQAVELEAMAHQGLVDLTAFSASLYQGRVAARGQLDNRGQKPRVSLATQVDQVQLQPLLTALAQEQRLTGQASIDLSLAASGNSLGAWQRSARGQLQLEAETLSIIELDIEKAFCEIAALANGKPAPQLPWKGKTDLQQVQVSMDLKGTQARFNQVQAGVEELQLAATGASEYLGGDFDLRGDLRVTGAANPDRACQIRDRWRNRDLPLRCRGNIDEPLSGRVCGPDRDRFNELLEDEAKARVQEKLQEKIQEKLKGSNAEQVETLLRGLFGR